MVVKGSQTDTRSWWVWFRFGKKWVMVHEDAFSFEACCVYDLDLVSLILFGHMVRYIHNILIPFFFFLNYYKSKILISNPILINIMAKSFYVLGSKILV